MDIFTPEKRSAIMRAIRSKDTAPEVQVRRFLRKHGFGYRVHVADLPGRPDIVLGRYKTAIFIHGCFWHGHVACLRAELPRSRRDYWSAKTKRNRERDIEAEAHLRGDGWLVLVLWTCQLRTKRDLEKTLTELLGELANRQVTLRAAR